MAYEFARITTRDGNHELQCSVGAAQRMHSDGILRSFDGFVTTPDTLDGGLGREHCYTVLVRNLRAAKLACDEDAKNST